MIDHEIHPEQRFTVSTRENAPTSFTPTFVFWGLLAVNLTIMTLGMPVIIASQLRKRLFT